MRVVELALTATGFAALFAGIFLVSAVATSMLYSRDIPPAFILN